MSLSRLLRDIRSCTICEAHLPCGPRPVVQASSTARILIAGQAPGRKVHDTGIPFNDPSGDRLRQWMGIDRDTFYDESKIALVPMGFCFPGTGKGGDLPPRPECAETWRGDLLSKLESVEFTIVLGRYALDYHLAWNGTLTDAVKGWRDHWPALIPLPHPSPRNGVWLHRNPWFEEEVLPPLRRRVAEALN